VAGGLAITNANGISGNPLIDASSLPCGDNTTTCRAIRDSDADGDICDDLQIGVNYLIDPGRPDWGDYQDIYLAAPPIGEYDCRQRVRICLSTGSTTGSNEPSCDAANQNLMPVIHGVGPWDTVRIKGTADGVNDPYPWEPNASGPDAMIWIGDLWNDEAGYVNVDWPWIWADDVHHSILTAYPWNRVMPIFCDGCSGEIGWKFKTLTDGISTTTAFYPTFVGINLKVNMDAYIQPGFTREVQPSFAAAFFQGNGISIAGTSNVGGLGFGRDLTPATLYFGSASNANIYGDTNAITFDGSYEILDGSRIEGGPLGAVESQDAQRVTLRGRLSSSATTKPTLNFATSSGAKGTVITFDGADVVGSQSLNMPVRFTGININANYPHRIIANGTFWNTYNGDNGGIFGCLNMTFTPSPRCIVNLAASRRMGKGPWFSAPPTKFDDTQQIFFDHPQKKYYTIRVPDGTSASGKCILNPLSATPTIGTCDATAYIDFKEDVFLTDSMIKLTEDSVASSSCMIALQESVDVGSTTFSNYGMMNSTCTADNTPHACCSGSGAGNCRSHGGWNEIHYGEAASSLRSISTDQQGETYNVINNGLIKAGERIRFQFQQLKRCNGGTRANWDCEVDGDCPSSTCGNITNSCGNTAEMQLTFSTIPVEPEPQCYDMVDNDSDGLVDFNESGPGWDTGCTSRLDNSE
jgi:hypothetical protein